MLVYPLPRTLARPAVARPLARALDASFERFFDNVTVADAVRSPAVDVAETDTAYLLTFDLPGVAREQLKVVVEGRRVSIESVDLPRAEAPAPIAGESADGAAAAVATAPPRPLYRERSTVRYARTLSLPAEVDQAASQARFENGVLTLTLTKRVPSGATQLRVD